jgi:hypothetical protein
MNPDLRRLLVGKVSPLRKFWHLRENGTTEETKQRQKTKESKSNNV